MKEDKILEAYEKMLKGKVDEVKKGNKYEIIEQT